MKNFSVKATLFIAFLSIFFICCKHEVPEPSTADCLKITINVSGTVSNASSSTATDGSITVSASGASGFTYSLNNGPFQTNNKFSNLAIGSYAVIAKSSQGCIGSAQFTVGNSDPCAATVVKITATIVNASSSTSSDGSITATASGGSSFQYKLNNGAFQTSSVFSGLAAGTYTITVKNNTGCTASTQFALSAGNVCASKNIGVSVAVTTSDKCAPTGTLTITATGSSGFSYQVGDGNFQTSNVFNNLPEGTYTVTVKDLDNCTKAATATISAVSTGTLFNNVKTLIFTECKPCHVNGGNNGGVNFDNDCNIVAKKDRIKARAVDGNPSFMPTNGTLSAAQKQKIIDWIDAGGKYTN